MQSYVTRLIRLIFTVLYTTMEMQTAEVWSNQMAPLKKFLGLIDLGNFSGNVAFVMQRCVVCVWDIPYMPCWAPGGPSDWPGY